MENPVYKDWDEFVNPDFILVHLNDGRKIKISKSNIKGGKLIYQSVLRAFSDNNFAITNKILDAIIKKLS